MHKDVLEFFIIANSVPILHLYQSLHNDADSVLRAGRISAQDILGEETTGELIQKEVLSESTIYYGRSDDILVALRVTSSMSDLGTEGLLRKTLSLIDNYRDLVMESFGDRSVLKPLTDRLDLLLGNKFPTNPIAMGNINRIMADTMSKLTYIDRLAIVTPEGWMVNILENNREDLGTISKFAWKNAVEMLHLNLASNNQGVITMDNDSLWFLFPIRYFDPLNPEVDSWWALIVQVNRSGLEDSNRPYISYRLQEELLEGVVQTVGPLISTMLERESRLLGLVGPLGKLFSLPEYMGEKPVYIEISENSIKGLIERGSQREVILQKDHISNRVTTLYYFINKFQPTPTMLSISENQLMDLVENLFQKHQPQMARILMDGLTGGAMTQFIEILEKHEATKIWLISENTSFIKFKREANISQAPSEAQIGDYFFVMIDDSILLLSIRDVTNKFYTLISSKPELIEVAGNIVKQLEFI